MSPEQPNIAEPTCLAELPQPFGDTEDVAARIAGKIAARYSPPIAVADLFLTEDCNHRCDYCFVRGKTSRRLTPEVAEAAVEFMLSASRDMTWISLLFFGGEPLLEFDTMRFIVDYCATRSEETGKEVRYSMTTNGTLMTEEIARFLAENSISYLLSIDGRKEVHDAHRRMVDGGSSFDAVMERLPMMKRFQPWQGTRMTLSPSTIQYAAGDVDMLHRRGINQFIIGPATGIEWSDEALAEYERQMLAITDYYIERKKNREPFRMTLYEKDLEGEDILSQWGCGAGRGRICIGVDGALYGCAKIVGVDGLQDTHKLGDIWAGVTNLAARRDLLNTHPNARPQCASCGNADRCSGGCPAVNWEATGSIFDPAPLECRITPIVRRIQEHHRRRADEAGLNTAPD